MCVPVLAACVDKETQGVDSDTDTGGGITTHPPTGSVDSDPNTSTDSSAVPPDDPTTSGGGSGDASSAGSDTAVPPDTSGDSGTTGGVVSTGCQKVDLLFVMDSASTMGDEQKAVIAAFPGFYDAAKATLGLQDFHVMTVSADDGMSLSVTSQCQGDDCFCGPAPTCCQNVCDGGKGDSCNGLACAELQISECAYKYGSGREYDAKGTFCELAEGRRYMLDSQPELHATFDCVARVGTYDNITDKQPMFAATEATSAAMNGPGGCDEGFLRSDALLVVVFASDKDDANEDGKTGSPGGPQEWYDALVAAKGGNADAVVVLGLVGDGNMNGGACDQDAEADKEGLAGSPAPRLQEFVGKFTHGAIGSVCADDYAPFFTSGIGLIDQACDAFAP